MSNYADLSLFEDVDGFIGAAIFEGSGTTPVVQHNSANARIDLAKVGSLANVVMLNARDATKKTGGGHCGMIHVHATEAHILVESLGRDSNANLVIILDKQCNLGLARSALKRFIN